jgi:DNA-binding transcriptional MerR regulator
MLSKKVRLIDIAREIERDKSTIIRWEEMGLIPVASRDSRGWRFYTEEEAHHIIDRVRATHYFKNNSDQSGLSVKVRPQRMVYIS